MVWYDGRMEPRKDKPRWQYWWGALTHPIDEADRLLVLLGALYPIAERWLPGWMRLTEETMQELAWQIPAGMIALFIIGRFIRLPFVAYN